LTGEWKDGKRRYNWNGRQSNRSHSRWKI
jgi:hypothetical protein